MQAPADAGDLSANETSLEWLKSKANDFYSQGNYRAALGAFSHALRLFPKVASLYSNRAACHFKLRNLIKCVEDATRALELLTPPVAANAKSRLR
jgi:dyslexia susceptibility 1 candidate gene 1 protein